MIDKQFKLDAVQYRKDHPELTFEQVAKNLGISNSSIHIWCKQFSDTKELARLKKENRDLKDTVEILKKAMSIVSSQ